MGGTAEEHVIEEVQLAANRSVNAVRYSNFLPLLRFDLGHDAFLAVAYRDLRGLSWLQVQRAQVKQAAEDVVDARWDRPFLRCDDRIPGKIALQVHGLARIGIERNRGLPPAVALAAGRQRRSGAKSL